MEEMRNGMKNRPTEKSKMTWDSTVGLFGQCTNPEKAEDVFQSGERQIGVVSYMEYLELN